MKRLTTFCCLFAAALAVVLTAAPAGADCRTYVRRTTYYQPTYTPYVEEYVKPVAAIYLPLYSAVYLPGYVPPAAAAHPAPAAADPCADVRAKALLLEQRLNILERSQALPPRTAPAPMPGADNGNGDTPPPAPPPQQPRAQAAPGQAGFVAWAGKNCASCHSDTAAKAKGGGFTLLSQGKLAELSPQQTGEVIRRISLPDAHRDVMPRGRAMPVKDRLEGVRLFVESN